MAIIQKVRGKTPQIGKDCYLAPNATVVGDVVLGDRCSLWFNAVLRGDVNAIRVGEETNIQDGAIIHCTYQKTQTVLGARVSIAHAAVVHGCVVEDGALIGMGAVVMDDAVVGAGSIVAAGAVVLEGTKIPPGSLYAGTPAKFIKKLSPEQIAAAAKTAEKYLMYSGWYRDEA